MNIFEKIKNLFKSKNKIEEITEKEILKQKESIQSQSEQVLTEKEILERWESIQSQPKQVHTKKIKTDDMVQFTEIKYNLNCDIHNEHNAYIILDEHNQNIAKKDFAFINKIIQENMNLSYEIKHDLQIPIEEITFYEPDRAYSKLVCTPYTPTGKISKYPIYLVFKTNVSMEMEFFEDGTFFRIAPYDSTHGCLYYTKNGNIGKADVIFWRKDVSYIYHFKSDKERLYINKIEKNEKGEIEKKVIFKA